MDWIFRMLVEWLPDSVVQARYVRAGARVGDSMSYIGIGYDVGLMEKIERWSWWEAVYANRGYRPLSHDQFIDFGGYGVPLIGLGEKLSPGEYVDLYGPSIFREPKSE